VDSHYRRVLEACYGQRRWILALDVLAGATRLVAALRDLGADEVFVIAGSRGTGPVPDDAAAVVLGVRGATVMQAIRAFEQALGDLDAAVLAEIDRFDPEHVARIVPTNFTGLTTVAGRPVHGARPRRWQALEDKTVIDAFWRAAGVPTAPSEVVAARPPELHEAAARLDRGQGTVWVADNKRGWHGGATLLRWVRTPADGAEAVAFFADRADRVRVMPFLEGIPCSIHGVVFAETTITLRPCEMIVLRRWQRPDLLYAGMATTWDPPAADRERMRALAVRVGDHLRRTVGYRGVFTVDGVMTRDGFRPTELNPRFGAAARLLASAAEIPLYLVHLAVVDGTDADWQPRRLERLIVAAADRVRGVQSMTVVPRPLSEQQVALRWDGDRLVDAGGRTPDVTITTGASPIGGAVRIVPDIARHPSGRSTAGVVATALAYADERWGLGIGPVEAAADVTADARD
jgi:hypothetical protein